MDFAQEQRRPTKHLLGMSIVVLMHIAMIYALVNGLARNIVEVIKAPLETKIIEEIKEKLPEPPPPPPKLNIPPPPFIPPPEISIQAPASSGPTISTVTTVKPVAAPPRPVEAPKPAVRRNPTPTFKVSPAYPRKAIKDNIEGMIEAHLTVNGNGDVIDVKIAKSVPRGMFDAAAVAALSQYKFKGDGTQWVGIVEIDFKLQD